MKSETKKKVETERLGPGTAVFIDRETFAGWVESNDDSSRWYYSLCGPQRLSGRQWIPSGTFYSDEADAVQALIEAWSERQKNNEERWESDDY